MRYMGSGIKGLGLASQHVGSGSAVFHGIRDQANNKNGFRDQNSHRFWDQRSTFWAKIWDQL